LKNIENKPIKCFYVSHVAYASYYFFAIMHSILLNDQISSSMKLRLDGQGYYSNQVAK